MLDNAHNLCRWLQDVARTHLCGRVSGRQTVRDGVAEDLPGRLHRALCDVPGPSSADCSDHSNDGWRFDLRDLQRPKEREDVCGEASLRRFNVPVTLAVSPMLQPARAHRGE